MWTDENNTKLELGRQIGNRGGEGCVFEILGRPELVAKVYHTAPNAELISKLKAQILITDDELRRLAAWPLQLLKREGRAAGFLMPKAPGKAVHLLYRPIDRRDHFPGATWQNLVSVSQNIAAAFHGLHSRKILMGDVNESNILITPKGEVQIIDCDSFQISHTGRTFPCDVHVPFWTPPELQGKNFGSLIRSEQHDAFGLAVLIFHVLFMGKHPFAGVPKARHLLENPPPLEECIVKFQFAHTRRATIQFSPPPHSLPLGSFPDSIADLFERAFLTDKRPSASEWHRELGTLRFQKCQWGHTFSRHQSDCPWCVIWNAGGPNFFVALASVDRAGTSASDIERLLREIERAVEPLLDDASLQLLAMSPAVCFVPCIDTLKADIPSPRPFPSFLKPYRSEFTIGWGMLIIAVILAFAAPGALILWFILGVFGFGYISGGYKNPQFAKEIETRRNGIGEAYRAIKKHLEVMDANNAAACRVFQNQQGTLVSDIRSRQGQLSANFNTERGKLKLKVTQLLSKYQALPNWREKLRRERAEKSQREEFLRRFRVKDHQIAQIGEVRSQLLAQFGVVTAWDVKNMGYVPRLGPGDATLKSWLNRMEQRFRFDPSRPLSDSSEQEIRRNVQKWEKQILDEFEGVKTQWNTLKLNNAPSRLQQLRAVRIAEYRAKLDALNQAALNTHTQRQEELRHLVSTFGQAKADADALPS